MKAISGAPVGSSNNPNTAGHLPPVALPFSIALAPDGGVSVSEKEFRYVVSP